MNFRELDDLIHSGVKEIVLDQDIVLDDGQKMNILKALCWKARTIRRERHERNQAVGPFYLFKAAVLCLADYRHDHDLHHL